MSYEDLNKENAEAVTATRWILGVGLGGILLFVVLAYLWFGLVNSNSNSTPTSILQTAVTSTISATPVIGLIRGIPPTNSRFTAPVAIASINLSASLATAFSVNPSTTTLATATSLSTATPFLIPTSTTVASPTDEPTTISLTPVETPTPYPTATAANSPTSFSTFAFSDTPTILATSTEAPQVYWPKTAANAFDQLQTLHFIIEVRAGKVEILTGTQLKRAEGDLTRSSSFQAKVLAHTFLGDLNIQTIGIANEQFITNPIGGKWTKLAADQSFNLSVLFDRQNGIGGIVRQLQNVQMLTDQTIDGISCVHFTGSLPGSAIGSVTLGTLGHNPVALEVWVGRNDNLIRQLYLKETVSSGAFWAINFSKFNQNVSIQKPIN